VIFQMHRRIIPRSMSMIISCILLLSSIFIFTQRYLHPGEDNEERITLNNTILLQQKDPHDSPTQLSGDPEMKNPKCPSSFFTRFFHSPRHNLAWCKVPKAGSSTWVENFLLLANQTEAAISSMDLVTRHQRMGTHYPRTMHQGQLSDIVNSSLIFMVVRHPLDRFLASYIDKIEPGTHSYFRGIYGKPEWPQFVEMMLTLDVWDEHWAPITSLCPPCLRYTTIARMETFSEDTSYIIHRAGLSETLQVRWSNRKSSGNPFIRRLSYYRRLTLFQVNALVTRYR